jgi:hypothetical protein
MVIWIFVPSLASSPSRASKIVHSGRGESSGRKPAPDNLVVVNDPYLARHHQTSADCFVLFGSI